MLPTIDEEETIRPSPSRQRIDIYEADRTLRVYSEAVDRLQILMNDLVPDHPSSAPDPADSSPAEPLVHRRIMKN
jgi:hypothetical protein